MFLAFFFGEVFARKVSKRSIHPTSMSENVRRSALASKARILATVAR